MQKITPYHNNLLLLSLAKLLSGFAGYIYDIGIVIYLFENTQSVAVIGGFFISQLLPAFLILISGGMIDKYNKKSLIIFSNLAKGAIFLLLIMVENIWVIYIVTFFFNLLLEFESNTFSSLMTNIFPKEKILKAASVINFLDSAAMIIAPVSASVIALYFTISANLLLDIVLCVLAALVYLFLKMEKTTMQADNPEEQADRPQEYAEAHGKGFGIAKNKKILPTVVFWNIFMLCIGITGPLEISMIEVSLGMPSSYYGIGNTVEGLGMLAASGCVFFMIRRFGSKHIILFGLISAALSYFVIGSSYHIGVYFAGAALVGMTSTFCPLGFKTDIQINSDSSIIGRTFATARFSVLLSRIIGSLIVGILLEKVGIRYVYYGVAAVLMAAALLYARKGLKSAS